MVSLWGTSKKDDAEDREPLNGEDGENEEEDAGAPRASPRRSERRTREADERTRLLPRNDGYLDPDDPAVSLLPTTFFPAEHSLCEIGTNSKLRYRPTTSGASAPSATSPSSSSSSASSGGLCSSFLFSSVHRR